MALVLHKRKEKGPNAHPTMPPLCNGVHLMQTPALSISDAALLFQLTA
jgi:hypothetical protein